MNSATVSRFWSKVEKSDGCWVWTASKRNKGYGAFVWASEDGRVVQGRAHRFAWIVTNGSIPKHMCVLHRCDNPACVRPSHLWLGTKAENNIDRDRKGRRVRGGTYGRSGYRRGSGHHGAKLSESSVLSIRSDAAGGASYREMAAKHRVSVVTIHKVVTRKAWKHVE